MLRFMTCGSVDDGKSTLIGRLLYDAKAMLIDTVQNLKTTSEKRGLTEIDFSALTDGLLAEREQGITIDVAHRYFTTGTRTYIIADTPGHEQYTRNMVTAASNSELAIILIDARKGVITQTKRHTLLANMMGIKHLVVAVNKMDLMHYSEAVFNTICQQYVNELSKFNLGEITFIPMSALRGDMIVDRGTNMEWYQGHTMFEILETVVLDKTVDGPFRMPVQYICHATDFRGITGRVESGSVSVGDIVKISPGHEFAEIKSIQLGNMELGTALSGQSVMITLGSEVDVSRGSILSDVNDPIKKTNRITAKICWMSQHQLDPKRRYLLQTSTQTVQIKFDEIISVLDVDTLEQRTDLPVRLNDVAEVIIKLSPAVYVDTYENNKITGSFIVFDPSTNDTMAGGVIL